MRAALQEITDVQEMNTRKAISKALNELYLRVDSLDLRTDDPAGDELFNGRAWIRTDLGQFRLYKNGKYRMDLVATDSPDATAVRVYVGGQKYAIAKQVAIQNIATSIYGDAQKRWLYGEEVGEVENIIDGDVLTEYGVLARMNDDYYLDYSVTFEFLNAHTIQSVKLFHRWSAFAFNPPVGNGIWATLLVYRNGAWETVSEIDLFKDDIYEDMTMGSDGVGGATGIWSEFNNLNLSGVTKVQVYAGGRNVIGGGGFHYIGEMEIYAAGDVGIKIRKGDESIGLKLVSV